MTAPKDEIVTIGNHFLAVDFLDSGDPKGIVMVIEGERCDGGVLAFTRETRWRSESPRLDALRWRTCKAAFAAAHKETP